MLKLDVDQTEIPEQERFSQALFERIASELSRTLGAKSDGEIAVLFVGDAEIQRLNRLHRGKDSVTDVLSFSYREAREENESLGDIVISYPQLVRQATDNDLELEVVDLVVHGVLHIFDYDHEKPEDAKRMFPIQDAVVKAVL